MKKNGSKPKKWEGIVAFLSEVESLRNTSRAGWRRFNIPDGERDSVAEHVIAASQIAFILATCEGLSPEKRAKATLMTLFHDNEETRLGDLDRVATAYLMKKRASQRAVKDQLAFLPEELGKELLEMHKELNKDSPEAIIARDADILEFAFRALIFAQRGFGTQEAVEGSLAELQTKSAKRLLKQALKEEDFANCWHQQPPLSLQLSNNSNNKEAK